MCLPNVGQHRFCLEHFLAELLVVSAPLLATSATHAHFDVGAPVRSDVRKHRVGDDCVVTDLVCDAPLHVTRFLHHQDPHARDLRVWRQFWIQFVLNRVRAHHLLQRERVLQRRSFRERHPSFLGILFFSVDECPLRAHALLFLLSPEPCSQTIRAAVLVRLMMLSAFLVQAEAILELVVRGLVTH